MPYPFLSDEWIEAAHAIRKDLEDRQPAINHPVRMNLVITEMPFDEEQLEAHMDTTSGAVLLDKGHLEEVDLTITVDYETAKAMLVDRNAQAGMQAFMAGKVRVQGDMAKLMAMQAAPPDEHAGELAERLRDITE